MQTVYKQINSSMCVSPKKLRFSHVRPSKTSFIKPCKRKKVICIAEQIWILPGFFLFLFVGNTKKYRKLTKHYTCVKTSPSIYLTLLSVFKKIKVTQQKHFLKIIKSHSFFNLTPKRQHCKRKRKEKPVYLLLYVSTLVVCAKHKLVQIRNPESSAKEVISTGILLKAQKSSHYCHWGSQRADLNTPLLPPSYV